MRFVGKDHRYIPLLADDEARTISNVSVVLKPHHDVALPGLNTGAVVGVNNDDEVFYCLIDEMRAICSESPRSCGHHTERPGRSCFNKTKSIRYNHGGTSKYLITPDRENARAWRKLKMHAAVEWMLITGESLYNCVLKIN